MNDTRNKAEEENQIEQMTRNFKLQERLQAYQVISKGKRGRMKRTSLDNTKELKIFKISEKLVLA
jgi:hypothetical protein